MPNTQLLRTLTLLYQMQDADQRALQAEIEASLKRSYRETMTEQAQAVGNMIARGKDPSGTDLAEIRRIAALDAQSITNTWNQDVEREITRLYNANPRGNRAYYFKNLEAWADARGQWKNAQIALMNEGNGARIARESFIKNNDFTVLFRFDGPAPRERECAELFAVGEVDSEFVRRHETPIHFGCPHGWIVSRAVGNINNLFLG